MALKSIVITAFIIIILGFGIYKIYSVYHRPLIHHLNPDMQVIGIVVGEETHEVSSHSILNGEDSILVVDHAQMLYQEIIQKIPQAKFLTPEELFSVNNLHLFDQNSKGLLTAQDSIFPHLFVIHFFDDGRQNDIKSANDAEIKGINTNIKPTGNYEVIMADGSKRTLYSFSKLEKSEEIVKESAK